jgi:hypothetical protein
MNDFDDYHDRAHHDPAHPPGSFLFRVLFIGMTVGMWLFVMVAK